MPALSTPCPKCKKPLQWDMTQAGSFASCANEHMFSKATLERFGGVLPTTDDEAVYRAIGCANSD